VRSIRNATLRPLGWCADLAVTCQRSPENASYPEIQPTPTPEPIPGQPGGDTGVAVNAGEARDAVEEAAGEEEEDSKHERERLQASLTERQRNDVTQVFRV
jgi:hypothetical protein